MDSINNAGGPANNNGGKNRQNLDSKINVSRQYSLNKWFKEKSKDVLAKLPTRGRDKFDLVMARIELVNRSTGTERLYFQTLANEFKMAAYTQESIVRLVCKVRSMLDLPSLTGNISKQCLEELGKVFVVKIGNEPAKGTLKGYRTFTPILKLLAD